MSNRFPRRPSAEDLDVFFSCRRSWDNMARFRADRARNKRYAFGDQWSDIIKVDGESMTEEDYIRSQGNIPLKNNLIMRLLKNVVGIYRKQVSEPVCSARDREEQKMAETMSSLLQHNGQLNRLKEVNARAFMEFLISSLVVYRKWYGKRNGRSECWTDPVPPQNFFVDSHMKDMRGWDCRLVGEVHDVTFPEILTSFARKPGDAERLKQVFSVSGQEALHLAWREFGFDPGDCMDFVSTGQPGLYRIVEVWTRETEEQYLCHDPLAATCYRIPATDKGNKVAENEERRKKGLPEIRMSWMMADTWRYRFFAPDGTVLDSGRTPYLHGSHPYVFAAFPFIDGELHSFVADVIDQQRYVNRLVTQHDWIVRASAKGVLLFPEECLPKGYNLEEIADEWSRFNGMIVIKTKDNPTGAMPQQIAVNATNVGINELLSLQLKFFEDISSVNGAIQGKAPLSGMSASLYAQQTQNAATGLMDILECFSQFETDGAHKDISNIRQFYTDTKIAAITGEPGWPESQNGSFRNFDYDLAVSQSTNTPVYRAMANEVLLQFWQQGQINLRQLLECGDFPFADRLLQSLDADAQEQGQSPQGMVGALPPEALRMAAVQQQPVELEAQDGQTPSAPSAPRAEDINPVD